MLTIKYQTAFKKDYKRIVPRGYDVRLWKKSSLFWLNRNRCLRYTGIIICPEIISGAGNTI